MTEEGFNEQVYCHKGNIKQFWHILQVLQFEPDSYKF